MGAKRIFLSSVNADLRELRGEIAKDLIAAGFGVVEQSYFIQSGVLSLQKLDAGVRKCQAVIHLIGQETGGTVQETERVAFAEAYPGFLGGMEPLRKEVLQESDLTYTQFEAYIALDEGIPCFIYYDNRLARNLDSDAAQERHVGRLQMIGHDLLPYDDLEELRRQVLHSAYQFGADTEEAFTRRISIHRLPPSAYELVGRRKELQTIHDALESSNTRLLAICGIGGMGKSSLVNKFIQDLNSDEWRDLDQVFVWSFGYQGFEGKQVASDLFLESAWEFLELTSAPPRTPWDKANRIAEEMRKRKTLVVLDGVETLQDVGEGRGQFRDKGIGAFLAGMATGGNGLCILTSRFQITDLRQFCSGSCVELNLEAMSIDDGVALLQRCGVKGDPTEMRTAVEDVRGHSLSLLLMGNYLATAHGGDIIHRHKLGSLRSERDYGEMVTQILDAYGEQIAGLQHELICVLGFSAAPLSFAMLNQLRECQELSGMLDDLSAATETDIRYCLRGLVSAGLLQLSADDLLDCHPLIREYARSRVETEYPKEWIAGNLLLYQELQKQAPATLDTLEDLEPLMQAAAHAAKVGHAQEAYDGIVFGRIWRGFDFFMTDKLGAYGANLGLMVDFFQEPWSKPLPELNEAATGMLLNEAGFCLAALGRFQDARGPYSRALDRFLEDGDYGCAARTASNLHNIFSAVGDLEEAANCLRRSIEYADRALDRFRMVESRNNLALCLLQMGKLQEALHTIEEAEGLKPNLTELPLHFIRMDYCRWITMLRAGMLEQVAQETQRTLPTRRPEEAQLTRALDEVIYLESCLLWADRKMLDLAERNESMENSVRRMQGYFEEAGLVQFQPLGWTTEAKYRLAIGDMDAAESILNKSNSRSESFQMQLHLADSYLLLGQVALRKGETALARESLVKGKAIVNHTGYGLRQPEVDALETALGAA